MKKWQSVANFLAKLERQFGNIVTYFLVTRNEQNNDFAIKVLRKVSVSQKGNDDISIGSSDNHVFDT